MKQSLQLRLGQHLTMTPQLQQAIRLLQLSTVELQAEIQQALESNPMLETQEDRETREQIDTPDTDTQASGGDENVAISEPDTSVEMKSEDLPTDLPVDSSWEDTYESNLPNLAASKPGSNNFEDDREFESRSNEGMTLQDHLTWQAQLSHFSESDFAIATAIIDSINDDGYFTGKLEEIHEHLLKEYELDLDEIEAVLHRIQQFDPLGVGARDLRETLSIQLQQVDPATPWFEQAKQLLNEHFELLANREFNQLSRRLKVNDNGLQETVRLIHTLNPRPGNQIDAGQTEYIVPDVFVRKVNGAWKVLLNPDATPKLNVNSLYASYIKRANKSADNTYMQGQLQEARWLIKSLQSRNETLMKVASCIVERQEAFLEQGEEAMKALVLHDVAESVGMHESTISRITNKKYMHTPRGIFELKYFFSSHVSTSSGGECSSTAIRALIKKMVSGEDARKPLSDSKIAKILSDQGINVARRTVAKYRDAMAIPPSNERKRIA